MLEDLGRPSDAIVDRRDIHPAIDHMPSVAKMSKRGIIPEERFASAEERTRRAGTLNVEALGQYLLGIGFWVALAPQLKERFPQLSAYDFESFILGLDDPNFYIFFNVLNGGVSLDYPQAFPELHRDDALLSFKSHKYYNSFEEDDSSPVKNVASVVDIISLVIFQRLNAELPEDERKLAVELMGKCFDMRVGFEERFRAYLQLDSIYARYIVSDHFAPLIEKFRELKNALTLDLDEADSNLSFVQGETKADVILVLYHSDPEYACYRAVQIFNENPGAKFLLPGGQNPHQVQALGEVVVKGTEFDEMRAFVQSSGHQSLETAMPDRNWDGRFEATGVTDEDLILVANNSYTTAENAITTQDLIQGYSDVLGRRVNVLLVTASEYGRRALREFAKRLDPEKAKLLISPHSEYLYRDAIVKRKVGGMNHVFSEWVKNLYDICMVSDDVQKNIDRVLAA